MHRHNFWVSWHLMFPQTRCSRSVMFTSALNRKPKLRQPAIASAAFISKVAECTAAGEREAMLIAPTRQRHALGAVKSAANGYRT